MKTDSNGKPMSDSTQVEDLQGEKPVVAPASKKSTPPKSRISWTIVNFWLDAALLVNFVLLLWISALLQFVFPAGIDAQGWTLWGLDVIDWQNFQFATLCALTAGILIHVTLHWSWICGVINKRLAGRTLIKTDGTDTLLGVGLIAVILHLIAFGVLMGMWMIQKPSM